MTATVMVDTTTGATFSVQEGDLEEFRRRGFLSEEEAGEIPYDPNAGSLPQNAVEMADEAGNTYSVQKEDVAEFEGRGFQVIGEVGASEPTLSDLTVAELKAKAEELGVEVPGNRPTKAQIIEAIEAAEAAPAPDPSTSLRTGPSASGQGTGDGSGEGDPG